MLVWELCGSQILIHTQTHTKSPPVVSPANESLYSLRTTGRCYQQVRQQQQQTPMTTRKRLAEWLLIIYRHMCAHKRQVEVMMDLVNFA